MRIRLRIVPMLCLFLAAIAWAGDRGYLGFDLSVDAEGFFVNATLKTVTIEKVVPNSPADKAGIVRGDRIIEIEGHVIAGTKADVVKPYLEREVGQITHLVVQKANGAVVPLVLVAAPKVDVK